MDRSSAASHAILPALRAATREAHVSLERTVDIASCLGDLPLYTRLLQNFLGFYRPLESRLETMGDWTGSGVDLPGRRKVPWLEADLKALGFTPHEITALPDARELPSTVGTARCLGCLYVLEGATLGGRQVTFMLRDSDVPLDARNFFRSYGAYTGARWEEFIAALENHAATGTDGAKNEIVESAVETFACLQRWIHERTTTP